MCEKQTTPAPATPNMKIQSQSLLDRVTYHPLSAPLGNYRPIASETAASPAVMGFLNSLVTVRVTAQGHPRHFDYIRRRNYLFILFIYYLPISLGCKFCEM